MENNKKHSIAFLIIGFVVIFIGVILNSKEDDSSYDQSNYQLLIIEKDNTGWYYEIYHKQELKIRQEFIPGIPGNVDFETKRSAETTGKLVVHKLRSGELPTLTIEELKKNGIIK